jgi:hypothetical protein
MDSTETGGGLSTGVCLSHFSPKISEECARMNKC